MWKITLPLCLVMLLAACSNEDNFAAGPMARKSTSLFVATDRHEAGDGNNLALSVQTVASHGDGIIPHTVLLGGDYVGRGPGGGETGQPTFSLHDLYTEIFSALSPTDTDILYGHNHSLEERGDSLDQHSYLLVPGDSISIQGDSIQGVEQRQLNFAYANAGYLNLGWSTLVTFSDTDGNGHHDQMLLRRFNVLGGDESYFGLTGKRNPYTLILKNE